MKTTTIKLSDGLAISRIVPGLMRLDSWDHTPQQTLDWIKACLDMGVTTFDHADIYGGYGNEARFGAALALEPALRDQMQLVSKCDIMIALDSRPQTIVNHYDTSAAHIRTSIDNSLNNLHTDYLDLLLIHRPDPLMNADETAAALTEAVQAGKVRAVGVSNFTVSQFELLQSCLDVPLVTNQVEYSVMHMRPQENGVFDLCQQRRINPMIWSPLAGGRIFQPQDERDQRVHDMLQTISEELGGVSLSNVALAWTLRHPVGVIPVLGTGKIERIREALAALEIEMDRQQWFRLWQASKGHSVP